MNCAFCDPDILSRQIIYHDDQCSAILDYKPAVQGHMLIIPNRHVERFEDLTTKELIAIHSMIGKVNLAEQKIFGATGYLLMQKNGKEAGQSVPHVHFHYFPRNIHQSQLWLALWIFIAHWQKPLSLEKMEDLKLKFADTL
ncbi:MAG TPA: HIT family protein [Chlamydiales bacterium]|nr:HIT family protein [Chlamydiales bacterium]